MLATFLNYPKELEISIKCCVFLYKYCIIWCKKILLWRLTYSIVIILWRKFMCDKSASGMLINPPIVFTFTRQRWSSTKFRSYLALLVWRSNIRIISHPPTSFSSCNSILLAPIANFKRICAKNGTFPEKIFLKVKTYFFTSPLDSHQGLNFECS